MKITKKKKNIILDIILIVLVIIFCRSTYKAISITYYQNKTEEEIENLINEVVKIPTEQETEDKQVDPRDRIIDFQKLKAINKDIVGWIYVPGTHIDYPIVKGTDNDYYLKRSIYKEYNVLGSIFMNFSNDSEFNDNNTILFGHNMKNGTMFGDLRNIHNGNFGRDIEIYIYTETGLTEYRVTSSYVTTPEDMDPLNVDTINFDKGSWNKGIDKANPTLTLSSCYGDSSRRVIIHAKRTDSRD